MMDGIKGKRILVTGGAGFIGSHIVDKLAELEARVVVVDDLSSGKLENIEQCKDKIEFVKADIRDEKTMADVLGRVDLVCHQAALRSVPKSVDRPFDYHDVNVTATVKLFLAAKDKGIKRIVIASSSSAYGDRDDFPEFESDAPKPLSPYAASKLMGEHYGYVFSHLYGMEIVSLRYFNVFGPRQSLENKYAVVVPKFIVSLLDNEQPPIYGDGEQERDFTYIADVVKANILSLLKQGIAGETFNIAGGSPKSVNYLLKSLKDIMGKDIEPVYQASRVGDVRKTHASVEKGAKLLGWKPEIGFQDGLKKTVEWFKVNHKK